MQSCTRNYVITLFSTYSFSVPEDHTVLFNATAYFANISADTPLGTSIIHFQIVINTTYFQSEQLPVVLSLTKNAQVQQIFKFENGDTEEEIQGNWSVETLPIVVLNRTVVYANEPPAVIVLPEDFDFRLAVFVDGGSNVQIMEAQGFVTVTGAGKLVITAQLSTYS